MTGVTETPISFSLSLPFLFCLIKQFYRETVEINQNQNDIGQNDELQYGANSPPFQSAFPTGTL